MNLPQQWKNHGPGLMIPVFFLSFLPVLGQFPIQETAVAASGGAFVSRYGFHTAISNQAGLGWINNRSVSVQHTRPFMLAELGISSISVQLPAGNGAIGANLSCFGIKGLNQTESWIAYGMKLHPDITAGAGILLYFTSIPDKIFFHPGINCALGLQVRLTDQLIAGGHVRYPAGWSADLPGHKDLPMILTAGFSYSFFKIAACHSSLQIIPRDKPQWNHGIELEIQDQCRFLLGLHNQPNTASFGTEFTTLRWNIQIAFEYVVDTGSKPSSSLTYVW